MDKLKLLPTLIVMVLAVTIGTLAHAGTIVGTVTYKGKVPKFREIKMDADPICLSKHSGKAFPQTLVLGMDNRMANVFVYIKDGIFDSKFKSPTNSVVITQKGCMYSPHVIGLMVDQPLKILNPDGTLHNVHALSKSNPEFNLAMPKFRREATKVFNKPEFMFPLKCDVHPWMSAWVSVMDHPFFAVTDEDGTFVLENVPFGQFKVVAWHEKLGTKTETINMTASKKFEIDFSFSR